MLNFSQFMAQLLALNPTHNQRKTERDIKIKIHITPYETNKIDIRTNQNIPPKNTTHFNLES